MQTRPHDDEVNRQAERNLRRCVNLSPKTTDDAVLHEPSTVRAKKLCRLALSSPRLGG